VTTPPLLAAPSLEQLRNRARDLQRAHRAGDSEARAPSGVGGAPDLANAATAPWVPSSAEARRPSARPA